MKLRISTPLNTFYARKRPPESVRSLTTRQAGLKLPVMSPLHSAINDGDIVAMYNSLQVSKTDLQERIKSRSLSLYGAK